MEDAPIPHENRLGRSSNANAPIALAEPTALALLKDHVAARPCFGRPVGVGCSLWLPGFSDGCRLSAANWGKSLENHRTAAAKLQGGCV